MPEIKTIIGPFNESLAYMHSGAGANCTTFVWLCGYHSDMSGSKAQTMHDFAIKNGLGSLRFDYSGHGQSGGKFENGTIGKWLKEAQFIIDRLAGDKIILVGSSMGGWLSLLLALNNPKRVHGIVLSAPAPDFTEDLMWASFSESQKQEIMETGYWLRPNDYDAPYKVTKELLMDGRNHLLLGGQINLDIPVRIIHGMKDKDVPYKRSIDLADKIKSQDVQLTLVKNGGHRLSEPNELLILEALLEQIYSEVS